MLKITKCGLILAILWIEIGISAARYSNDGISYQTNVNGTQIFDFDSPNRIIGGRDVQITEVPWQIALMLEDKVVCGGSIISNRWVLTAAQCVQPYRRYVVRAGSRFYQRIYQEREIDYIMQHADYRSNTVVNDIALLRLRRALKFDKRVSAIKLAGNGDAASWYFISGWGSTVNGVPDTPIGLKGVRLEVVPVSVCRTKWAVTSPSRPITDKVLCATGDGKAICHGDFGGPLIRDKVQFGINSFFSPNGCSDPNTPNVFTDVRSFRSWITEATQIKF